MKLKLVFFIFSSCIWLGRAQINTRKYLNKPLTEVLSDIEKHRDVKFSFSDDMLATIKVSIEIGNNTLGEVLRKLEQKTGLVFQKVTKRYIIVTSKKNKKGIAVCGLILDDFTEEPLVGVSVALLSEMKGTVSDEKGSFRLNVKDEKDTLLISYIGFEILKLPAGALINTHCTSIKLNQRRSILEEILITDYLTGGIDKKTDGSVVVSPNKIGILPGLTEPDVLQSIQLLPGIQSPNETASGLHIRGGTPDQNLILFDGIKMYHTAHFFGMLSAFNPYVTKNIKVFRSGVGAKYGNHISGVVDIETDTEIPKKTTGGFGFNLTHIDSYIKMPISKKVGIVFSARRAITDFLDTPTFKKLSKRVFQNTLISRNKEISKDAFIESNTDFYFFDFNSKILVKPTEKDKLIFSQLLVKNDLDYTFDDTNFLENSKNILSTENKGFNVSWDRKWNAKTTQKVAVYLSDYNFNYKSVKKNTDQIYEDLLKTNKINDVGFEMTINRKLSKYSSLNLGYQYADNQVAFLLQSTASVFSDGNYKEEQKEVNKIHAFFGEYVYQKTDKMAFHFGVRTNNFSLTNKSYISPRVYLQYKMGANLWLKGSAEMKQQAISQIIEFSTSDFGLGNQIWALANEEDGIPILESSQYNVGFIFKKDGWMFDLDLYQKKVNGLTSFTRGFTNADGSFSDGESNSQGLDVLIKKQWNFYNSWVSYSRSNTKFLFEELNVGEEFDGNHDISHSFYWSHNLKINKVNFSLGWKFRTGIPFTPAKKSTNEGQIIFESINSKRLPNYHRLDFSTTYTFNLVKDKNIKGKIGLSFINIYNQKNILNRKYDVGFDENEVYRLVKSDNFSLGFTPNMVFRVSF